MIDIEDIKFIESLNKYLKQFLTAENKKIVGGNRDKNIVIIYFMEEQ